jgi:hypothetical protein
LRLGYEATSVGSDDRRVVGARFLRRAGFAVTLVVVTLGLEPVPAAAAPTPSNPITYVYDEIGRLEAVVDPTASTNGVARYAYDDSRTPTRTGAAASFA